MVEYSNIKIPRAFFEKMQRFFEDNPSYGYRNPSEFIMEAIRQKFDEICKTVKLSKEETQK